MNKKQQQAEDILQHGFKLKRIFNIGDEIGPVELCKKVHRLETTQHRLNEISCTREMTAREEKQDEGMLDRLDAILGFKALNIPVFVNGDPRGYAFKIPSEYVREHNLDIHTDWGGYGIIAPEF